MSSLVFYGFHEIFDVLIHSLPALKTKLGTFPEMSNSVPPHVSCCWKLLLATFNCAGESDLPSLMWECVNPEKKKVHSYRLGKKHNVNAWPQVQTDGLDIYFTCRTWRRKKRYCTANNEAFASDSCALAACASITGPCLSPGGHRCYKVATFALSHACRLSSWLSCHRWQRGWHISACTFWSIHTYGICTWHQPIPPCPRIPQQVLSPHADFSHVPLAGSFSSGAVELALRRFVQLTPFHVSYLMCCPTWE